MSKDVNLLDKDFQHKLKLLMANCELKGIVIKPYFTTRTPLEQMKLWRQGRSGSMIQAKIKELKGLDCDYLAELLEKAGPQNGDKVTNALGGQSWHQYGLACDFMWIRENGNVDWSLNSKDKNGNNGYLIMHEEAHKLGLFSVYLSTGVLDGCHIQATDKKLGFSNIKTINDDMERLYK